MSQLYIYFSSNFYTLSLKHLADVNEHRCKKTPFFGIWSIVSAVHAAEPGDARDSLQITVQLEQWGQVVNMDFTHMHCLHVHGFPHYRPGWRGACCLYGTYACMYASLSTFSFPLASGITNHCSSLVLSYCTFFCLSKCSNHPNSAKQKSEARSVLHYSCCQSHNQKSKFRV